MQAHHEGFTWVSQIPGIGHYPNHLVTAILVSSSLVIFCALSTVLLKKIKNPVIPSEKLNYQNFFEILAEKIYAFCEDVMGEHAAERYFPIVGTLFIFVFSCNLLGLVPGFLPPTDNINVTLSLGLFVFIFYNYQGIRENGFGYLKHFLGPVWYLAPLMLVVEIVGHVFRPISLALRLRGNMMGDHAVLGVFLSLVPYGIPVIFYALGVFVSFIQAFVFCLLTMVYINLSTAHDH